MPEEGKKDSESSCSFFGKRKAITRKNALCLRRKRTRKAVVPSSEKEKRLPERIHYVCGENGLGKQLFPLRKRKAITRKYEIVVCSIMFFDCNKYALILFISRAWGKAQDDRLDIVCLNRQIYIFVILTQQ